MSNFWQDLKLQFKMGDVTTKLIFWNVGIFLISLPLFFAFSKGYFEFPNWIALSSDWHDVLIFPWTLLSYSFLHGGLWHLAMNVIVLNFIGRMFLTYFSSKQLLGLYLLAAVFSGLAYVVGATLLNDHGVIVGASGAVMAVLFATTIYGPNIELRLWGVITIRLWHFTAFFLLTDIMYLLVNNTGGHVAHLSGAFFGFLYIKLLQNGTDLSKIVTSVTGIFDRKPKARMKTVHKKYNRPQPKTKASVVIKGKTEQQIDEILDKIGRSGYDSLSKEEKEFLGRAGKE
jgi:membrane associated rhomboid family serine protease